VIATCLPVAAPEWCEELEALEVFRALPGVEGGDDQTKRVRVLRRDRRSVEPVGEEAPLPQEIAVGDVGRIPISRPCAITQVTAGLGRTSSTGFRLTRDALPTEALRAPRGDAVEAARDRCLREREDLAPRELERVLHLAEEAKPEGTEVNRGNRPDVVDDGPVDPPLPWRKPLLKLGPRVAGPARAAKKGRGPKRRAVKKTGSLASSRAVSRRLGSSRLEARQPLPSAAGRAQADDAKVERTPAARTRLGTHASSCGRSEAPTG